MLQSTDKRGRISFRLDFQAERLQFEVFDVLVYGDDGTAEAAESVAEVKRFFRDYFGNGKLEIYNTETGALISRKDAYPPVNIRLDFDASAQDIMYWRGVAGLRRQRTASVGDELVQWADPYFLSIAVRFHFDQLSR